MSSHLLTESISRGLVAGGHWFEGWMTSICVFWARLLSERVGFHFADDCSPLRLDSAPISLLAWISVLSQQHISVAVGLDYVWS